MNNNDEKIFGFPGDYLDGALGYPDYDLERTFTIPDITGDRIFNKANTDLSKGILSLAGIKSSNIFCSFGKGQENSGIELPLLDMHGRLVKTSRYRIETGGECENRRFVK